MSRACVREACRVRIGGVVVYAPRGSGCSKLPHKEPPEVPPSVDSKSSYLVGTPCGLKEKGLI